VIDDINGNMNGYYSKPYEALCKENFAYIIKTLNMMNMNSGLKQLIDDKSLHSGLYKHLSMRYKN
jgi:hypothetical protein